MAGISQPSVYPQKDLKNIAFLTPSDVFLRYLCYWHPGIEIIRYCESFVSCDSRQEAVPKRHKCSTAPLPHEKARLARTAHHLLARFFFHLGQHDFYMVKGWCPCTRPRSKCIHPHWIPLHHRHLWTAHILWGSLSSHAHYTHLVLFHCQWDVQQCKNTNSLLF